MWLRYLPRMKLHQIEGRMAKYEEMLDFHKQSSLAPLLAHISARPLSYLMLVTSSKLVSLSKVSFWRVNGPPRMFIESVFTMFVYVFFEPVDKVFWGLGLMLGPEY